MMSTNINTFDVYKPAVSFTIARADNVALADYVLSWTGKIGATTGSLTFDSSSRGPSKIVPVNQSIIFTPIFNNLPSNNKIIQYKWSFGDGREQIVFNGTATPINHTYKSGMAPISGVTTCLMATLTAIDQYHQHVRAYKVIHLVL